MNTDTALKFLRVNQPLPDDAELSEELITTFDEVRKHFIEHQDSRCLPLFLGSFGNGDGFGVYQLVEDVFRGFNTADVVNELEGGLKSPRRSTRYWSAHIAAEFPSVQLLNPLAKMLEHGDEDERSTAAIALGQIDDEEANRALLGAVAREREPQVRQLLEQLIKGREQK